MTLHEKILSLPVHNFLGSEGVKPADDFLKREDVLAILNQYEVVEVKGEPKR